MKSPVSVWALCTLFNMRAAIILVALVACTFALYDGLSGADLRAAIKKDYYSHHTLGYKHAREHMYGVIDNQDGYLLGIYTDLVLPFPYGYMHTSYSGTDVNCEHIVPQSFFGKKDPMVSDVHH
ncbi:endonuclease I, partial [Kipferlia bialata]|eukprot:g15036.t1